MDKCGEEKAAAAAAAEYKESNVKRARLESTLAALLDDPLLADVPRKPSLSDVGTLLQLELGSAMRISILKLDRTSFNVAVMNSATVKDLKLVIKNKINGLEQSQMGHRHISWKHVWGNFCLSYHNEKQLDDNGLLQDYGVLNNSQVYLPDSFCSPCHVEVFSETFNKEKHRFFHGLNKRCMGHQPLPWHDLHDFLFKYKLFETS